MLDKFKKLREMQKQAKEIQKTLADEMVTVQKDGVEIKMNGNMEVQSVKILEASEDEKLEENVKEAVNDAIKQSQRIMAQKMMGGGMNIPGL